MKPTASLLLPDIERLRRRLASDGDLKRHGALLRHAMTLNAPAAGAMRPFHAMLWPAATDDWPAWLAATAALRELNDVVNLMMDPWVTSSLALRLALHTAWAADAGRLNAAALRAAAEPAIHACRRYVWPMFRGRAVELTPPDRAIELSNQVSGMVAGMLFVGHVFGERLMRNRVARDLYRRARDAYPLLAGALDADGYQGEGPTYQVDVEAPGLILGAELLDAVEGGDHYHQRYPHPRDPGRSGTAAAFVETSVSALYDEAGVSLPLDDYGCARPPAGFPLVYAAARSGQRRYLDLLAQRGPFGFGRFLWFADDFAWQTMYWPDRVSGRAWQGETGDIVLPRHFAVMRLAGRAALLQLWDRCDPLPHTHAHINPNSITVTVRNVPVIVESRERHARPPFAAEPGMRLLAAHLEPFGDTYRFGPADYRGAAGCAPGAHNVVLIDDREVVQPRWDAAGALVRHIAGPMAALTLSDATPIYEAAGIPLLKATRTTLADRAGDAFWVGDDFLARQPHRYTWQIHVRGDGVPTANGVSIETREGVGLEICAPGNDRFESRWLPSYPAMFEGECVRLRRHASGVAARFVHRLRPFVARPVLADLTNGWRITLGEVLGVGKDVRETGGPRRTWTGGMRRPAFWEVPEALGRCVTYRRRVRLPGQPSGTRWFLHLPLPAGRQATDVFMVWVNGEPFDPAPARESHYTMLSSVIDITRAVRGGRINELCLHLVSSPDGGTRGPAVITVARDRPPAESERWRRTVHGVRIDQRGRSIAIALFGAPARVSDARCGLMRLRDDGRSESGAWFDCTRARLDTVQLASDRPFSLQWDAQTVWLILPPEDPTAACSFTTGGSTRGGASPPYRAEPGRARASSVPQPQRCAVITADGVPLFRGRRRCATRLGRRKLEVLRS